MSGTHPCSTGQTLAHSCCPGATIKTCYQQRCSQKGSTFGKLFGPSHQQDLEEKRNLKRQRLWPSPAIPTYPLWCKESKCHVRKGLETVQVCSGGVDQQSGWVANQIKGRACQCQKRREKKKTERKGKCFWKSEPNKAANPQIIPERGLKEPPAKTREKLDYNWPVSTGFDLFI